MNADKITVPAHTRTRNSNVIEIAPHQALALRGPRAPYADRQAARAVRMQPDQLEVLAAIVYIAVTEYDYRALGRAPKPPWGYAEPEERKRWIARVERELEGCVAPDRLSLLDLSELRRYRLLRAITAALTCVA